MASRRSWAQSLSGRPQVEALEERDLLNNRFVVPAALADNVTNFATLQAALLTPGLTAGDVIQVQHDSAPGTLSGNPLPPVATLTVQGEPAYAPADIPAFTVGQGGLLVGPSQGNFTLTGVSVMLQDGSISFSAAGTLTNSIITSNFTGAGPITLSGATAVTVSNSRFVINAVPGRASAFMPVLAGTGSSNVISGNTFLYSGPLTTDLLDYTGSSADRIVNNTFQANTHYLLRVNYANGLTIQGNTFLDSSPATVAITIADHTQNTTLGDNTITLTAPSGMLGIDVLSAVGVNIVGNVISTSGLGTGLLLHQTREPSPNGSGPVIPLSVRVEGNDFRNNKVGVNISLLDSEPVDLGGGSQGSRGGNDFRGFTALTGTGATAIAAAGAQSDGPVFAEGNRFSVPDPQTVIARTSSGGAPVDVITAGSLIDGVAFVVAPDGSLWEQTDGGWFVVSPAGTILAASTTSPSAQATSLSAFAVASDHSLWEFSQGWTMLSPAGTVLAASAMGEGTSDVVFAITADHNLWEHNADQGGKAPFKADGWAMVSGDSFQSVSAGRAGWQAVAFGLLLDSSLWEYSSLSAGGTPYRQMLAPPGSVLSISALSDVSSTDLVFAILADHHLWEHSKFGWGLLSSGSFAQVSAGTDSAGQAVAYGLLSDGSLWEQDPAFTGALPDAGWTMLSPAGTIAAIAATKRDGIRNPAQVAFPGQLTTKVWGHAVFVTASDGSFWEYDPNAGWMHLFPWLT
jgi:hypothetical protein